MTKRSINRQVEMMGFRSALYASTDILAVSGFRTRDNEFERISQEQGLKAALDWRDKTLGLEYLSSERAEQQRTQRTTNTPD